MPEISYVGCRTTGHCSAHYDNGHEVGGMIVSGMPISDINGRAVAAVGCTVQADCGSTGIISTGSSLSDIQGKPMARKGDQFSGEYSGTIIEGLDFAQSL